MLILSCFLEITIIQVIKKYVEVDDEGLDIQIAQPNDSSDNNEPVSVLCANIPIKNMKHSAK